MERKDTQPTSQRPSQNLGKSSKSIIGIGSSIVIIALLIEVKSRKTHFNYNKYFWYKS